MDEILSLILNSYSFLYKDYGCRFCGSLYSHSFGGNSILDICSESILLRFTRDRGYLDLLLSRLKDPKRSKRDSWTYNKNEYDIQFVYQALTGELPPGHLHQAGDFADFVKSHFRKIEEMFDENHFEDTKELMKALRHEQAKRVPG